MKIVVAHPGRQHSFRVAKALKDGGMLFSYITTVYNKDNSLWMKIVKKFLGQDNLNRANKRKCPSLSDSDVVQFCEFEGLLLLAISRIDHKNIIRDKFAGYISRKFQRKLAKYIIDNKVDAVISYDTNSKILFEILSEKAPNVIKIMDNAHPNRHYLYKSYHENWDTTGPFHKTLEDCGFLTNEAKSEKYGYEAKLADYHIVASEYSKKSLEFENILSNTIFKIPYGVDENRFIESTRNFTKDELNILFLGEINQRKGVYQILETAKELYGQPFNFNLIGYGVQTAPELYEPYRKYVKFWGRVSFECLQEQISKNHVFVFPSMGEGFGLVILEAMAAGLPVIATPNCAGSDIIRDGYNGFIVPVGDTNRIIEKLQWLKANPHKLSEMSINAIATAKHFTWPLYEDGIRNVIRTIVSNNS